MITFTYVNQITGKKELKDRIHICQFCQHQESRDTASAKIIMQRGQKAMKCGLGGFPHEQLHQDAVGHTVFKNACGGDAARFKQLNLLELVGSH